MISYRTPFIGEPMWGNDHNSTLLYIESRVVNHGGVLDNRQLRIDGSRHPTFMGLLNQATNGGDYPTRLQAGSMEYDHDDLDCILDLWAAGLVTVEGPDRVWWDVEPGQRGPINSGTHWPKTHRVQCGLTDKGWERAAALRRLRGDLMFDDSKRLVPA